MTFLGHLYYPKYEIQAKHILSGFLKNHYAIYPLILKNRRTYK